MEYKWDIEFEKAGVIYSNGKEALKDINLKIQEGEFVAIIGLSGAGKTTLLKTINKINDLTSGELYVGDRSPEALQVHKKYKREYKLAQKEYDNSKQKKHNVTQARKLQENLQVAKKKYDQSRKHRPYYLVRYLRGSKARQFKTNIGMVFQRYNLIYKSTVLNNVLAARLFKVSFWRGLTGIFAKKDKNAAFNALAQVNILETAYSRAGDLSGGQMQRVALARTIAQEARIILADEPVGALDPIMAKAVMDSFLQINHQKKRTVVINLHHVDLALQYASRIIGIKDGSVVFDDKAEKVDFKVLKSIYGDQLEGFDKYEFKEIARKRTKVQEQIK